LVRFKRSTRSSQAGWRWKIQARVVASRSALTASTPASSIE
jgi:hypothetical protein